MLRLVHKRLDHRIDDCVGFRPHLVIGRILDRVRDEDPAHLGEKLILPPAFEHLRDRVEPVLTPLPDPRADWSRA